MTSQLRLLSNGDLPERPENRRAKRSSFPPRLSGSAPIQLDVRTRRIGQSGVTEARRRLAEIRATAERAYELVEAS